MPTVLSELIEAEAHNFVASKEALGKTLELVNDFESVYEGLTPILTQPKGDPESDDVVAVVSIIHELMFCRGLLTKSVLSIMRGYQGDAMLHLRRAIEACAFAVRLSKHPELSRVWAKAFVDDAAYKIYRKSFKPEDLFPNGKHPDHDPILTELKSKYDLSSKLMHGSIFGMAGHFGALDLGKQTYNLKFFDLPLDHSLISVVFLILYTHRRFLHLFGRILEPHTANRIASWQVHFNSVEANLEVHRADWRTSVLKLKQQRQA